MGKSTGLNHIRRVWRQWDEPDKRAVPIQRGVVIMQDQDAEQRRDKQQKKGLVIVNTGQGKGKSTAAIGTMLRAWGHGMAVCVIQFLKQKGGRWGEAKAAKQLGIEWHSVGDGFVWRSKDMDATVAAARRGWAEAQERIAGGGYDLIILDEFTYPLSYGWLDTDEVLAWLRTNKPPMLHLLVTGRQAPPALMDFADLVTKMTKVKHPLDVGIRAQRGIEF
jgi:cob(I)alamin adenosyltransferase